MIPSLINTWRVLIFLGLSLLFTHPFFLSSSRRGGRFDLGRRITNKVDSDQYSYVPDELLNHGNYEDGSHLWWELFKHSDHRERLPSESRQESDSSSSTSLLPSFPAIPRVGAWKVLAEHDKKEAKTKVEPQPEGEPLAYPPSLTDYVLGHVDLDQTHLEKVQELWSIVRKRGSIRHLCESDRSRVFEALKISYIGLWGKKTSRSLEVSINRATGVAAVLGELRATPDVILAAILQEVLQDLASNGDGRALIPELRRRFGHDVLDLCAKYAVLPKYMARTAVYTPLQAENQLQMMVVFAEDYRALYIRLADRLHTLRVLRKLPLDDAERVKIAEEALYVYAPLAHRMGVMKVKGELEDLAFRVLEPEMFQRTRYTQIAANKAYHEAAEQIKELISNDSVLTSQNVSLKLTFRIKDKYQLYLKMRRKGLSSPSDVRDALGLRLIIDLPRISCGGKEEESSSQAVGEHLMRGQSLCYYIVERLRSMAGWEPAPNGFKDYIRGVKSNGYSSLHQYIRNRGTGTNVEVQVRTREMHLQAELGGAAHWHYKDQLYRPDIAASKLYRLAWRSSHQLEAKSAAEMLALAKVQLLRERVFVFSEDRSTVLNLKKGATALDAAFAIHTDIGLATKRVLVNGKEVRLGRPLQNGEVVSVETHAAATPAARLFWLGMVRTSHAQSALRKFFRENHLEEVVCLGLTMLLLSVTLNGFGQLKGKLGQRGQSSDVSKRLLDGPRLAKLARDRCGMSFDHFLQCLALSPNPQEIRRLLGRFLDLSFEEVQVVSRDSAFQWARLQGSEGWEDDLTRQNIIAPLLNDILPSVPGLQTVKNTWERMIGVSSFSKPHQSPQLDVFGAPSRPFMAGGGMGLRYSSSNIEESLIQQAHQQAISLRQLAKEHYAAIRSRPVDVEMVGVEAGL